MLRIRGNLLIGTYFQYSFSHLKTLVFKIFSNHGGECSFSSEQNRELRNWKSQDFVEVKSTTVLWHL